ncbi:MAG: DivIVA domain-containing protein [Anaerorhabdus sp.]
MSDKINLSIEAIMKKEFSIDFKGYCASEVDSFLDLIIEDVETYVEALKELSRKNLELEENAMRFREYSMELEAKIKASEQEKSETSDPVSQLDILKRLSRLEKVVYENFK